MAGPEGVLTGSSRLAQEAKEKAAAVAPHQEIERRRRELERKRRAREAQVAALQLEQEAEEHELKQLIAQAEATERQTAVDREEMAQSRRADGDPVAARRNARKT